MEPSIAPGCPKIRCLLFRIDRKLVMVLEVLWSKRQERFCFRGSKGEGVLPSFMSATWPSALH
jgi:hypothetical protein